MEQIGFWLLDNNRQVFFLNFFLLSCFNAFGLCIRAEFLNYFDSALFCDSAFLNSKHSFELL